MVACKETQSVGNFFFLGFFAALRRGGLSLSFAVSEGWRSLLDKVRSYFDKIQTFRKFCEEKFAEVAKRNVQLAIIPDERKEKFLARIRTWENETLLTKHEKIDHLQSELASLKAKVDRLNNGFTMALQKAI